MSVLTAVCLMCNAHIVEDQKQFESHYETHHRRRQTPAGEIDPGESWEFLFTSAEELPKESTVAQLDQTQNCGGSEADRTAIETQLHPAVPTEKLSIDQVDVQLDRNQTETQLDASVDSRGEMVSDSEEIDAEEIQLIKEVSAKNAQKEPRRNEIGKTPMLLKMKNLVEETLMTIAENVPKRLDSASNSAGAAQLSTKRIRETNGNRVGNVGKRRRNCGPLSCLHCGKSFLHLKSLRCHWYTHGTTKFPCDLCEKIYSQPNSLRDHKRGTHRTQLNFASCEESPTEPTVVQLETHLNAPENNCEEMLNTSEEIPLIAEVLRNHSVSAEQFRKRPDSQSNSSTTEDFATELIRAQLEMNNSTPTEFEEDQADQHSTTTETNANRVGILVKTPLHYGRFKCFLCGKSYAHPVSLRHHLYTHGKTKFPCSECGKICSHPKSLYEHKRVLHPTKDLPIDPSTNEGDNSVTAESTLTDHSYSQTHLNISEFPNAVQCEECGKMLAGPVYLRRHLKRLHPTEADLICECPVCHKQFAYKSALRNHSAIHRHRNLNDSAMSSTE